MFRPFWSSLRDTFTKTKAHDSKCPEIHAPHAFPGIP